METMKAVVIRSYGGLEVLEMTNVPVPEIKEDEILVGTHAVGVNPLDWKVRAGYLEGMLNYRFPLILGWDVSGIVKKAGAGVSGLEVGDEVYALADITRNGGCAEYVAIKANTAALKPGSLDHVEAASVPMAALTAWQAIFDIAKLEKGQKILVHAAAGGIGTMAVQLAKWRGAYVIGTASEKNRNFVLKLGADEVIDYTAVPFEEQADDVDVVLDTMGGDVQERSLRTLKKSGVLVSLLGPPDGNRTAEYGVRGEAVLVQPDATQLSEIAGLIDSGQLETVVSDVLSLEETGRAHEMSETQHVRGKIVLKVRD